MARKRIVYLSQGDNIHDLRILGYLRTIYHNEEIILLANGFFSEIEFKSYRDMRIKIKFIATSVRLKNKLSKSALRQFISLISYTYQVKFLQPNLVVSSQILPWGFYAAIMNVRPHILFVWGSDIMVYPRKNIIFKFLTQFTLRKTQMIIVDSIIAKNEVNLLLNKHSSQENTQYPILLWLWSADFLKNIFYNEDIRNKYRDTLGWNDKFIIFSNRWLDPIYNVDKLISIIPHAIKINPNLRFLIINNGIYKEKMELFISNAHMNEYVKFMGRLKSHQEMINYLCASDACISISDTDTTATSVLEAVINLVPCILSDIPGNNVIIHHKETGLLINQKNKSEIRNAIIELSQNKDLWKKIRTKYKIQLDPWIRKNADIELFINALKQIKSLFS